MKLFLCDTPAARALLRGAADIPVLACTDDDGDDGWQRVSADPERLEGYSRGYRDCIARLSAANAGLPWWANPVSEKNEHDGGCYRHLVWYAELLARIRRGDLDQAAVIAPAPVLLQLEGYCIRHSIAHEARFRTGHSPLRAALRRLKWLLVYMGRRLFARGFAARIRRRLPRGRTYVLRTWLNRPAVEAPGDYADSFFGSLHLKAARRGYTPIFVAGILQDYLRTAAAALIRQDVLIIPEEYFLRQRDILACALAPETALQAGTAATFMGEDVAEIIAWHMRRGHESCAVFLNLLRHAVSRRLHAELKPAAYVQTFENYAWEKLAIAGLRAGAAPPFIIGFQHAFLCQDSFKYFPGPGEAKAMPLPDRIVTLGETTAQMLRSRGDYAGVDIRTGCALRQDPAPARQPDDRPLPRRVMIPLSLSRREIGRILEFLSGADGDFAGWEIALRFHPHLSWDAFSRDYPRTLPKGVGISQHRALAADLAETGALAYTWSTVALEAYARGIPAIHLDILQPLRVDPLYAAGPLKYEAARPRDLPAILKELARVTPAERREHAGAIGLFIKSYFHAPHPAGFDAFFPDDETARSERRG